MPIDIILDANIPKKVKGLNGNRRVLHIGDVDTEMQDEDILQLTRRLSRCLLVTHDRELALKTSKKRKALFIRKSLAPEEIVECIEKNSRLLKTASLFCENGVKCKNCR
ncbi:MAG: hypothetical protein V3W19_10365 [Desulfatiglandales bacterium]